jgi:hypothetical protein
MVSPGVYLIIADYVNLRKTVQKRKPQGEPTAFRGLLNESVKTPRNLLQSLFALRARRYNFSHLYRLDTIQTALHAKSLVL